MTQPFIGQISMFANNFAPRAYAFCNGQLLPIAQNQALFALIGTYYGGNGQTNFGLPNLQGRTPIHFGNGAGLQSRQMSETGGTNTITLTTANLPQHTHSLTVSAAQGTLPAPVAGAVPASPRPASGSGTGSFYAVPGAGPANLTQTAMAPSTIANSGGGQPIDHRMPSLAVNFCIALQGIFPSRN